MSVRSALSPLAGIAALLLAVCLRGLFPVPYALAGYATVIALFLVLRLTHRLPELPADLGTYALGALFLAYVIAVPGAASLNQALIGCGMVGAWAAAYWLGRRLFRGDDGVLALLVGTAAIGAAGSAIGLFSLVHPAGLLHNMTGSGGRMAGVLEYANASGMLSGLGALAAFAAARKGGRLATVLTALAALSCVGLLHTASIGALVVTLAATISLLFLNRSLWPHIAGAFAGAFAAYLLGGSVVSLERFLLLLVGVALSVPMATLLSEFGRWASRKPTRTWGAGAAIVCLLLAYAATALRTPLVVSPTRTLELSLPSGVQAVEVTGSGELRVAVFAQMPDQSTRLAGEGGVAVFLPLKDTQGSVATLVQVVGSGSVADVFYQRGGVQQRVSLLLPKLLKGPLYSRYLQFLASDYDLLNRVTQAGDALKMVAQRPIRGFGGGGWQAAYQAYESYAYVSTELHDFLLQIGVESGGIGLLAFLAVLISVFLAWKRGRGRLSDPRLLDGVAVVAGALLLHSLMDWDLAIPAMGLLFFTLLGALAGQVATVPERPLLWKSPVYLGVPAVFALVLLSLGQFALAAGDHALSHGKPITALSAYQQALTLDPISAAARYDVGEIEEQLGPVNPKAIGEAYADYATAVRLSPMNYLYRARFGLFLARNGQPRRGMQELQQAIRLAPMRAQVYLAAVGAEEGAGYVDLARHNRREAIPLLQQAVADVSLMAETASRQPSYVPQTYRMPATMPEVRLYGGMAALMLGRYDEAERLLPPLSTNLSVPDAEALAIAYTALHRHERDPEWPRMLAAFSRRFPGLRREFAFVYRLLPKKEA